MTVRVKKNTPTISEVSPPIMEKRQEPQILDEMAVLKKKPKFSENVKGVYYSPPNDDEMKIAMEELK